MGAIAAYEPPVLVSDHRTQLDAYHAMRAANDQSRVRGRKLHSHKQIAQHAGFRIRFACAREPITQTPEPNLQGAPEHPKRFRVHPTLN